MPLPSFGAPSGAPGRKVLAAFVAGALVRLALLRFPQLWYDEATVGIMGLVVLRGEWPIYFHGQPFMGALDAYLAAPVYYALGASARTLELLGVLTALAWYGLVVRLAWEGFGSRAAFLTALLLVVPPDYLLYWSHEGRPVYLLGMSLGTLALLLALRAPRQAPGRSALTFALLGGVLGMAFWTNFLTLVYFPAVAAVLLLRGFRLRHVPASLVALPAFVLGSLPHWLYGLPHGTAIPPPGERIGLAELGAHLAGFAQASWPLLAGVPLWLRGTPAGGVTTTPAVLRLTWAGLVLALAMALVYAGACLGALAAVRRGGSVARSAAGGLLVLVAVNLGVAVGTQYGRFLADDARYLVPLYTAGPVLMGRWLASFAPPWTAVLTGALLVTQGADALTGSFRNLAPSVAAGERALLQVQLDTIAALERQGLTRLEAPDFGTRVLTFLSRERVIFANHYEEIYPPYVRAVDGAERTGWWLSGRDGVFEANLAALGARFVYYPVPPLGGVYADFTLPTPPLRPIDPARMSATASVNPGTAAWAVDRDIGTIWSTGRPKRGGEWLQVDLGAVEPVALVRWLPGTYQEVPGGLALDLSRDGASWQRAIELPSYVGPFYWSAGHPLGRVRAGRVELRVPPTAARYLRITQLGESRLWPWTIRELFVYAAAPGAPTPAPEPDGVTLARALRAVGVARLYADHGWSARVALSDPGIRVLPANLALDTYNFIGSADGFWPRARWTDGAGVLLEPADAESFATLAQANGLGFTQTAVGGLVLFAHAAPPNAPPGVPLPAASLVVSASRHPERAPLAVDGDPATRWATAHPQTPGDWVRVDLAEPRLVRAVRLATANPTDSPRGLALEGSGDGTTWRPIAAARRAQGPLRWAGVALLRDGVGALRLDFTPVRLRALRLTLTAGDPVFDWSIHELTVYE